MTVIITAGMIGVGKTTATELLAKHLDTKPFYEPVDDNPILPLYYADPKHHAFALQIFFLNKRFKMIKEALTDNNNILDRSIYEDALFAKKNNIDGNIPDAEFKLYEDLLDNMLEDINARAKTRPDLMVFLDAGFETILYRIKKRGRDYEQIDESTTEGVQLKQYYFDVWSMYRDWYENYDISPKIRIDLEKYDLSNDDDKQSILSQVDAKMAELNMR